MYGGMRVFSREYARISFERAENCHQAGDEIQHNRYEMIACESHFRLFYWSISRLGAVTNIALCNFGAIVLNIWVRNSANHSVGLLNSLLVSFPAFHYPLALCFINIYLISGDIRFESITGR